MTADLSPAELDRLAQFEAAGDAPEALRERVARAIWEGTNGEGSHLTWEDKRVSELYRRRYRHLADATLAVVRPPAGSPGDSAEKALRERMEALADELDVEAIRLNKDAIEMEDKDWPDTADMWREKANERWHMAARIRSTLAADSAQGAGK